MIPVEVNGRVKSEHSSGKKGHWSDDITMNTHLKSDSLLDESYSGHAWGLVPIGESSHKAYTVIYY